MLIKGRKLNKGEWAEFYVMLRLLGQGRLYAANELLQKKYRSYLDVLKIIRQECPERVLEYVIDKDKQIVTVTPQNSDVILASIPTEEFDRIATELFYGIRDLRGRSIEAPDAVCDFARVIYVDSPKAPAVRALSLIHI